MTKPFMVVDFNSDGSAEAMHRDQFDLGFLGKQEIQRASEIVFDPETQKWDITVTREQLGTPEAFFAYVRSKGYATYEEARTAEVTWFEDCRLLSLSPLSIKGASLIRRNNNDKRKCIPNLQTQ